MEFFELSSAYCIHIRCSTIVVPMHGDRAPLLFFFIFFFFWFFPLLNISIKTRGGRRLLLIIILLKCIFYE